MGASAALPAALARVVHRQAGDIIARLLVRGAEGERRGMTAALTRVLVWLFARARRRTRRSAAARR
jgi:hypothetical protein